MRATFSLMKKRGWKANILDLIKNFFVPLGIIYTVIQIIESILDVKIGGMYLVYFLAALLVFVLIYLYFRTHSLLLKTFKLRDNYKITISVEDYIDNTKKYPRATYVTGINDQFDLSQSAVKTSLLADLLTEFFKKSEDQAELQSKVNKKIENYKTNGLEPYGTSPDNEKKFKHGSIISEKFIHENVARNLLFFTNSAIISDGEFNGSKKTASTLKLIWSHLYENHIKSDQLLMPLLGTGFSRDTTPMSATISIIDQFFAKSYPTHSDLLKYEQLVPHLVISIQPEMIIKNKVDLLAVHKFIEVMNERLEYAFTKEVLYKQNIEGDDYE